MTVDAGTGSTGGGSGPEPVLRVRDLSVRFAAQGREVEVVRGVSFDVHANEVLGIVGESGSGKSVTSLAVTGLLPETARVSGSIRLAGVEVTEAGPETLRLMRGRDVGMVFQDPNTSLNPVFTTGRQVVEGQVALGRLERSRAAARSVELLGEVDIPDPAHRLLDATARHLALWMSYEDPIRVADLKTRRTRFGLGKRKDTKRAIVTLKSGSIDIFTYIG